MKHILRYHINLDRFATALIHVIQYRIYMKPLKPKNQHPDFGGYSYRTTSAHLSGFVFTKLPTLTAVTTEACSHIAWV